MSALHREHPDATPEELDALARAALLTAGPVSDEPRVERTCRDCQNPYTVPASKADAGTKWWSLCGGCLAWEL